MKTAHLSKVYQLQTGISLSDALNAIYDSFLGKEIPDEIWAEAIQKEIKRLDFNDPMLISELSASLQQQEKKKHTTSPPGTGQLEFEELTYDWAINNGIAYKNGMFVPWIAAKPQHSFEYVKQRQKVATDANNSVSRSLELHELVCERGGLKGALKRRGVKGW